jgi:hypothetical protein
MVAQVQKNSREPARSIGSGDPVCAGNASVIQMSADDLSQADLEKVAGGTTPASILYTGPVVGTFTLAAAVGGGAGVGTGAIAASAVAVGVIGAASAAVGTVFDQGW